VTMIELHVSPAKSTPLAHFVVKRMLCTPDVKSSIFVLSRFWSSRSLSFVIMLSSMSFWFSSSEGRSLKAETWTRVGGVALASCISRVFRNLSLVIVPFLKLAYEQFSSAPVFFLFIVPGFFASASIILNSFRPKISFNTFSEWRVPDIRTRILF